MPLFSSMLASSLDVSISARATPGTRRAFISKSSRRHRTSRRPQAFWSQQLGRCRALAVRAAHGWRRIDDRYLYGPPMRIGECSPPMTTRLPASTLPSAPPPVLYWTRTVPMGVAPLTPLPKRSVARSFWVHEHHESVGRWDRTRAGYQLPRSRRWAWAAVAESSMYGPWSSGISRYASPRASYSCVRVCEFSTSPTAMGRGS